SNMEARSRLRLLTLVSSLLLVLIVTSSANPLSSSSLRASGGSSRGGEKVTLALYYETLCPYCSNCIVNYLPKLFDGGLIDIVDLKLVPYGNAKIGNNNSITCQHGPAECLLNTIEACAIGVWPDVNEHFPFIYCVETLVYEQKYPEWETCFEKLNLDPTPVTECYSSGYGNELELKYAAETNALQPRHTYVPWVVVNGEPLYDDYENFVSYVCKAYTGTKVPEACSDLSRSSVRKKSSNSIHPVCYSEDSEETTKSTLSRIRSAVASWVHQVNTIASM
ncbi:hypothetical protein RJ640_025145, partial [Escallonia rubra]